MSTSDIAPFLARNLGEPAFHQRLPVEDGLAECGMAGFEIGVSTAVNQRRSSSSP